MDEYLKIQSYAKFYTQIMILELFHIKYQIQKHIKKDLPYNERKSELDAYMHRSHDLMAEFL